MNTHAEYRRHIQQPQSTDQTPTAAEAVANHLAVRRDPSLRSPTQGLSTAAGRHIAWVRPTDLHTYAGQAIGRGIDLQAELIRRLRQSPRQLSAIPHRTMAPSPPTARTTTPEGLQL
jgi:hypothetical protein